MLSRTIDAIKRFLVEQHLKAVLVGHALHEAHEQHVMVDSQIGLLEDRGTLKLVGGHLVVAGLNGDAQLQGLYLQVFHESHHTLRDGTEIVVVHLLVLGALVAHQRATGKDEVGTGGIQILVDEEILLLPTQVAGNLLNIRIEVMAHIRSGHVHSVEGTEQRSLVVEGLTRVGNEDGGDTKRVVDDKHRRRRVPSRVAASLKSGADTT